MPPVEGYNSYSLYANVEYERCACFCIPKLFDTPGNDGENENHVRKVSKDVSGAAGEFPTVWGVEFQGKHSLCTVKRASLLGINAGFGRSWHDGWTGFRMI